MPALRSLFEDSEARGPPCNNPPACCPRLIETSRGFRADLAPFGMHLVMRGVLCFDRIKRARTNMQRHFLNRNPARGEGVQKPWGEMQARRWRRDRPRLLRKERLIVLRVPLVGRHNAENALAAFIWATTPAMMPRERSATVPSIRGVSPRYVELAPGASTVTARPMHGDPVARPSRLCGSGLPTKGRARSECKRMCGVKCGKPDK